ncbi:MAG: hypothetical protein V4719_05370 [Planctomycetota bacterium]
MRSLLLLLCWGCCALGVVGCELFPANAAKLASTENGLPNIKVPPDSIELEIMFVERPTGDRLMGDTLWNEVDTILNLEPQEQRDLARNGFRIGVAGSHPPAALQQLLEIRAKPKEGEVTAVLDSDQRLQGNRIFVSSGGETQIQLNDTPHENFGFKLFASHNTRDPEVRTFSGSRCLYRVSVRREQPGWARLEFVPEIHHGMEQLRPTASADQWELKSQPNIEKLYAQRFTLLLNTGDMALVTGRVDMTDTAGHRFFTGPEGHDGVQRMLIVRLARVSSPEDTPFVTAYRP